MRAGACGSASGVGAGGELGEDGAQDRAFSVSQIREQIGLHGTHALACAGVNSGTVVSERDRVRPPVCGVRGPADQPALTQSVNHRDQPSLVVADPSREHQLRWRGVPGELREDDVLPHREADGVQERPLGFDQPARDLTEERAEIRVVIHAHRVRLDKRYAKTDDLLMPINVVFNRSETRSIAIDAPPHQVHRFIADPVNIPRWAPAFATAISPSGEHWIATTSRGDAKIVVASNRDAGTVDILSAADRTRGAFARVIPNGPASEVLFTLFFEPDTPAEAIAAQMTVVEDELTRIRQLVL